MSETENKKIEHHAKDWLTYRPGLKVLDCTIRDGGLMNSHKFPDEVVKAVYTACVEGGIDYMEIGYKNCRKQFSADQNGPWKFCGEDDIRRIVGDNDTDLKISIMADAEKSSYKTDILPREQSVIDLIRVASYIHQMAIALDMIKDAHDKGYEVTCNLMAVSAIPDYELEKGLEMLMESEVETIYVVDSFGSLYSEQVHYLVNKYLGYAKKSGKKVGMHAHNNMQLAFANTIEAIVKGADMVDASLAGLGRGAGNCQTELLISFLHNPKYRLRPLIDCVQHHIEPMRAKLLWGYDIPYMLTGVLNQHPRTAITFNEGPSRGDLVKFYDSITEQDQG